jgi:polyribonucleotide nucleotidyltransferase
MKPESKIFTSMVGGKPITFETGTLAGQAGGAVTVRLGDTMIFAAATMSPEVRLGIDYFPLTVDYEERMYAGGRIPGSFFRREGRPSEVAILIARLTDRPLRPLFPKDLRNDVQVILYSFSVDGENPIDALAINAASTALMISDVPWGGPVAAVRIGRIDGQLIVNPTTSEQDRSDLDLRIAGTRDAILMVECGATEVPEAVMVDALNFGHQSIQPLIDVQEQMAREIGKPKQTYVSFNLAETVQSTVDQKVASQMNEILDTPHTKAEMDSAINA